MNDKKKNISYKNLLQILHFCITATIIRSSERNFRSLFFEILLVAQDSQIRIPKFWFLIASKKLIC